jgi:hypothetical protein
MGRRLVLALGLGAALAGCGASAAMSRHAARGLPRPFTVVARYDARALGLRHPDSLAVGPDGNVYVTDASDRVTVISPRAKVLRRWGRPGGGPGEFRFTTEDPTDPHAINGKIAVGPNGLVYVSDSGNARVEVFTSRGRFVRQFGHLGSRPGEFLFPFDLAVDPAGDVYVADDQIDGAVSKFSAGGRLLWRLGSRQRDLAGHHEFGSLDAHGRLVVMANADGRVIYLDGGGHEVDAFGVQDALRDGCDVTVDEWGDTYVTGCTAKATAVFDRRHRLVADWPGTRDRLLWSPRFGPDGEVFALRHVAGESRTADQLLKLRLR